ncbi:LOG family protein [Bacteroidota bacterium]
MKKQKGYEIESLEELHRLIQSESEFINVAFQNLDLSAVEGEFKSRLVKNCIFLGCTISDSLHSYLSKGPNLIFPQIDVPYNPYKATLYSIDELYDGFNPSNPDSYKLTPDFRIYEYYNEKGKYYPDTIFETLAQKLHDHSITDAFMDVLENLEQKKIIAIMGGHGLRRDWESYYKVAQISKQLVEEDYFMLSGGGPGAMEATHLGAWMAKRPNDDLVVAVNMLSEAPHYSDKFWLSRAFQVIERFPKLYDKISDIGIPTWLYGHEPATPFAALIAKYFENSVREEGLLAYAFGGVIYSPGSAGTIQEIFQDAAQNHYKSYEFASPMIFLDTHYWNDIKPIYPLLNKLAEGKDYKKWLKISDEVDEIVNHIKAFTNS